MDAPQISPANPAAASRAPRARRSAGVHDPSTIVRCDKYWYVFATGKGISSLRSRDLISWERGPSVFPVAEAGGKAFPAWWKTIVPGFDTNCWAPDVIQIGSRYYLYYSVSAWGKNASAIGLVINETLDPARPNYHWIDAGIVTQTGPKDDHNAIDPSVCRAKKGDLWMAFGSFWSGIKVVRLDSQTGLRTSPDTAPVPLAYKPPVGELEAACLFQKGAYWYLFVNGGRCCQGIKSTYEIRVGRSKNPTGPFVDRTGRDMRNGGGSLFLASDINGGAFIGPGHAGIVANGKADTLSCHFYDGDKNGVPTLGLLPLAWSKGGWPEIG